MSPNFLGYQQHNMFVGSNIGGIYSGSMFNSREKIMETFQRKLNISYLGMQDPFKKLPAILLKVL